MEIRSEWLTGVRIHRLGVVLTSIANLPIDVTPRERNKRIWRRCGGALPEIQSHIDGLNQLGLVRADGDALKRTAAGDRLARNIRSGNNEAFGLMLIRAGVFHDQARVLIESGHFDSDGNLHFPTRLARTSAPQLVAVLEQWDGVRIHPELLLPKALLQELNTVWALLPPEPDVPKWAAERRAVGNRAEMYTVQYERSRTDASHVLWVSRDTDKLGWDVEDRSVTPPRCIEVKGRRDADVVFYLSENEWNKAQLLGPQYEIQFWGEIELSTEPAIEYATLRASGYPIIIRNINTEVAINYLAEPVTWRITRR